MPARRARLASAHALAWVGWGAAAALIVAQPIPPSSLALGAAVAAVAAACVMLLPARTVPHTGMLILSATAVVVCAVWSSLTGTLLVAGLLPWLAGAAAGHLRATSAAAAADPALAPLVRLAPTLLALALGTAAGAGATALGLPPVAVLVTIAVLQVGALLLLLVGPVVASTSSHEPASESVPPPARLLPLLGLAVAGATALIALRPALSTLGADESHPAGPAALTLVIGGLAGPPLAALVSRLGLGRGGALLATLGGAAALIAPIARPGALDLIAAAVLGVALAAVVALSELARRSGVKIPPKGVAVLLLAGALGAVIAGLLLSAVPLPDVVLGASLACLVAGLGAWAPAPRERVS